MVVRHCVDSCRLPLRGIVESAMALVWEEGEGLWEEGGSVVEIQSECKKMNVTRHQSLYLPGRFTSTILSRP